MDSIPKYLTDREVAKMTNISLSTLRNQRSQGRGFSYHKIGRSVRYKLADVVSRLEAHKIEHDS